MEAGRARIVTMKTTITKLTKHFLLCGLVGWCMEILFTSLDSFRRRDMTLKGTTSIWMFPIYGMAAFLTPVISVVRDKSIWLRGFLYASCIFITEFITGLFLSKRRLCPWSYRKASWNIKGVVRLDYLPFWFLAGLLFEKLLTRK